MSTARTHGGSGEGGFAMVAVLLVLAMIGLLGAEFAYSMRLEARATRNYKDAVLAGHLAEAGFENAVREIVGPGAIVAEGDDGLLTFYTPEGIALKRLPREAVPLGIGQYSYRITDEAARLNLTVSNARPVRLNRLLQLLELEKQDRDVIVDSIEDWIDDNDEHRANGAESDDHYMTLPVPYRARNADIESIGELLQIKGVTPELFHGTGERPGLADLLTVAGRGEININTASRLVLATLGVSEAQIVEILATRRQRPYTSADLGRFSQYGLVRTTQTYRIEALGLIDGTPRARLTAVVEVEGEADNRSLRLLSWTGIR